VTSVEQIVQRLDELEKRFATAERERDEYRALYPPVTRPSRSYAFREGVTVEGWRAQAARPRREGF
jgi:hypothetical protein